MTEPTAGDAHPDLDTLADLDAGVLDGAAGEADLRAHVAGCANCAGQAALLVDARSLLGEPPVGDPGARGPTRGPSRPASSSCSALSSESVR